MKRLLSIFIFSLFMLTVYAEVIDTFYTVKVDNKVQFTDKYYELDGGVS